MRSAYSRHGCVKNMIFGFILGEKNHTILSTNTTILKPETENKMPVQPPIQF